ncbi:MAG: 3-isopropylmalate dehydrogenase [Alphaproteobacteria bacterium]|nr:3-isopropylmalate dehydrogenase [Alphaproteobacteria bacterium]
MTYKLQILAGDGIGPEIMAEVKKLINWINGNTGTKIETVDGLIGGASYDEFGEPLTDKTLAVARDCDAVLLGAVGGPKWDGVPYDKRPEAGLLKLRKDLDLFANLRPALVFDALIDASTLKPEIVKGLDILIVRELTGGVYFGEPRGIEDLGNGERRGINTQVYTTSEINRVARVAFDLARKRSNKVTSCEKANVMESGKLWREDVTALHKAEFSDVQLEHMYADNCAMQLLRNPSQFDVIVTDNLFGDILSDEAAMLTGSLGMLPSASLGAEGSSAVYEPVHGSAPDIAGQGIANPLATILSFAMCLRYSLNEQNLAQKIEDGVQKVLSEGLRTPDIMSENCKKISTSEMGDALITAIT